MHVSHFGIYEYITFLYFRRSTREVEVEKQGKNC